MLLLDDDANTLLVLHAVLERTEARIIECEDEVSAFRWSGEFPESVDLLVSDVVLKSSNGPAVARQLKPLQPNMRTLFISGFSLGELQRRGLLRPDDMRPGRVEFLQKPFSSEVFLSTVDHLIASE